MKTLLLLSMILNCALIWPLCDMGWVGTYWVFPLVFLFVASLFVVVLNVIEELTA